MQIFLWGTSLADEASMRKDRIPPVTFEVIAKKDKGPSFGVSSESQCSEAWSMALIINFHWKNVSCPESLGSIINDDDLSWFWEDAGVEKDIGADNLLPLKN